MAPHPQHLANNVADAYRYLRSVEANLRLARVYLRYRILDAYDAGISPKQLDDLLAERDIELDYSTDPLP